MNIAAYNEIKVFSLMVLLSVLCPEKGTSQQFPEHGIAYEDYATDILSADDNYFTSLEEWQNMIDQWLEKPLYINSEEADWLMEYKIISLLQLNKLKEYRNIYGDLLSVYELAFIDGWDFQTIRKTAPLVTTRAPKTTRAVKKFTFHPFSHQLILKTSFNTEKSQAYRHLRDNNNLQSGPHYSGTPARMAIRYDFEYRNKLAIGIRSEKDPGEPYYISHELAGIHLKSPDLLNVYVHLKDLGPFNTIILGAYRINFGYGINLTGGQSAIKSRNGISGMSYRVRPQTSVSETGFFRGGAFVAGKKRIVLAAFASSQNIDGSSVEYDSLTGKPLTFSSISRSGLHRTTAEFENRKAIREQTAGGFLVYRNNWLKTGFIAVYNRFNASIKGGNRAYQGFELTGKENIIGGISSTIWLPGIYFFNESSFSRNKGFAALTGIQLSPAPGIQLMMIHRYFGLDYQNWNGSGFISASRNAGESGLEVNLRVEMAKKWLIDFMADHSRMHWVSYSVDAPARRREVSLVIEKVWAHSGSFIFSLRYLNESIEDVAHSQWICRPVPSSQYRFRVEGRMQATERVKLKSRIEYKLMEKESPGWLIFQDIEFTSALLNARYWLRICYFDARSFENNIYAYENDVLFDFSSFMHYGKGLRGVLMIRANVLNWLDLWLRFSTVYYTNKNVGSGWDELEGNRQNEIEVQLRIKLRH